jgi:hypothetical protein
MGASNLRRTLCSVCGLLAIAASAAGQDEGAAAPDKRFELQVELKAHYRHTDSLEVRDDFPFPPPFIPAGQDAVFLRPPESGGSFEISTVTLIGEANLSEVARGRVEIHVLDLYNRNPTSSAERVQVREAWVEFGRRYESLEPQPEGRSLYLRAGKSPRFSRQRVRRLESYGLWSTAVGRFEEVGVELGGGFGRSFYWRAHLANGNALFMRDPNALAGDNGTPEHTPGAVDPIYDSGFPILYDTDSGDLDFDGELQLGAGFGYRQVDESGEGFDLLGWYFERSLAEEAEIDGSFYSGDIKLLQGPFFLFPLPIEGDDKREWGLNLEGKWSGFLVFAQVVDQEIAGLGRSGAELEVAKRIEIAGVPIGDTPVFRWIQPTLRASFIDNDFEAPDLYPNPAVDWDWRKYDIGVRVGIVPGVDLTAEYSKNDVETDDGTIHPDEWLVTLRSLF